MKRIQIDMSPEGVQRLEELKEATEARTNKELFDQALTLFDWAVTQMKNGRHIASTDANFESYRELSMPSLENARRQGEKAARRHEKQPVEAV